MKTDDKIEYVRCGCCDIELKDSYVALGMGCFACERCAKGITNEEFQIRLKAHIKEWNPKLYEEKYGGDISS